MNPLFIVILAFILIWVIAMQCRRSWKVYLTLVAILTVWISITAYMFLRTSFELFRDEDLPVPLFLILLTLVAFQGLLILQNVYRAEHLLTHKGRHSTSIPKKLARISLGTLASGPLRIAVAVIWLIIGELALSYLADEYGDYVSDAFHFFLISFAFYMGIEVLRQLFWNRLRTRVLASSSGSPQSSVLPSQSANTIDIAETHNSDPLRLGGSMNYHLRELDGEKLRSIFDAAYMDCELNSDGDFSVTVDDLKVRVLAQPDHDLLKWFSIMPFPGTRQEALEFANRFNSELVLVRANAHELDSGSGTNVIWFDYDYPLFAWQSIDPKSLIAVTRKFSQVVHGGILRVFKEPT